MSPGYLHIVYLDELTPTISISLNHTKKFFFKNGTTIEVAFMEINLLKLSHSSFMVLEDQ